MSSPSAESNMDWQNLSRSIKVNKIINDGYLSDCKFVVGPENETETICGHKIFYALESPVFAKMFEGNYVESKHNPEIRITDTTPRDFKNLSIMIYTNCASNLSELSLEELIIMYRLCDKYLISSISQTCTDHMKNSKYLNEIPVEDFITLLKFAKDLTDKSLLIYCMDHTKSQQYLNLLSVEDLITLLKFAKDLTDKSLLKYCIDHLKSQQYLIKVSSEDLIQIFEISRDLQDEDLRRIISTSIQSRHSMPISRANILTEEAFCDYVQILSEANDFWDDFSRKECFVFSVINSYFEHNNLNEIITNDKHEHGVIKCEKISENIKSRDSKSITALLNNLLKLVDWGNMSAKDFKNGPGASKILNYEQKYKILSLIT